MKIHHTNLKNLLLIEPEIYEDERGYFYESFNSRKLLSLLNLKDNAFVQDNQSKSKKGVLRGLHFQKIPAEQGKLVRVVNGSVLDVVVDIRKDSETYGEHFSIKLSGENHKMLWIPSGFAHGFLSLEDDTIFCYKCTNYYSKEFERCIVWNDFDLNIDWGIENPIVSEKDQKGIEMKDLKDNTFIATT